MAKQRDDDNNVLATFLGLYSQLLLWNLLPNGRPRPVFTTSGADGEPDPESSGAVSPPTLTSVLTLVAQHAITPHIAARIALPEAAKAMALAESKTIQGKIVLVPSG